MTDKDVNQENESMENKDTVMPIQSDNAGGTGASEMTASNRNMKWTLGIILLIAAVLIVWLLTSNKPLGQPGESEPVAKVNGEAITKDKLYDRMYQSQGDQMLEQMIREELINQEAKKANITVSDKEINKAIDEQMELIKAQFQTQDQLDMALTQQGLTMESLKENLNQVLLTELKLKKLVEPQVDVSDEKVAEYFEEYKAGFTDPERIRASHILVETSESAESILQQLKDKADFAELAKEHSIDGTSASGGDLNYFGRGEMVPAFEKAAFSLAKGEISKVVQTEHGYHIIKVTDIPKDWTLDEKKEEVKEELLKKGLEQKLPEWIEKIEADADIKKL